MPVTFSILTNIAAFMPMFFVPGIMGKIFQVIPVVVVSVFTISLIESLFVLPAHLAHQHKAKEGGVLDYFNYPQRVVNRLLQSFIKQWYTPVLKSALRNRYITVAVGMAMLLATVGLIAGGRVNFNFMP